MITWATVAYEMFENSTKSKPHHTFYRQVKSSFLHIYPKTSDENKQENLVLYFSHLHDQKDNLKGATFFHKTGTDV